MVKEHTLKGAGAFREIVSQSDEMVGAFFHLCAYNRLAPAVFDPNAATGDIGVEGEWEGEGTTRKYTFTLSYNGKGVQAEYSTPIPLDVTSSLQSIEALADKMFIEMGLRIDYQQSVEELRDAYIAAREGYRKLSTEERDEACSCELCTLKAEMRRLMQEVKEVGDSPFLGEVHDAVMAFFEIGYIALGDEPATVGRVGELAGRVTGGESRIMGIVSSDGNILEQMHPNAVLQVMAFLAPIIGERVKEAIKASPTVH